MLAAYALDARLCVSLAVAVAVAVKVDSNSGRSPSEVAR